MKKWLFALVFTWAPIVTHAACVPGQAVAGMIGCWPLATSMSATTDYLDIWRPGVFPASAQLITPVNLAISMGGPFLPLTGGAVTGATTFGAAVGVTGLLTATGGTLIGTGTIEGSPYQFQSAINFDPSAAGASGSTYRKSMFNTTLTYAGNTTNVWEGLTQFTTVNGPGQANGEINGIHSYAQFNAGSTIAGYENFEASLFNNGAISGSVNGFLSIPTNGPTGTAATIFGMKFALNNQNTTVGSITTYAAIDNEARLGAGTDATTNYFIRNADTKGYISTLAPIVIGSLGTPAGIQLQVVGADNSGATLPVDILSANGNHSLRVGNDNTVYFANLVAKVDGSGNFTGVSYKVSTNQVVGARQTGWAAMTGTPDIATAFATSTVTLAQLAGRVMSLQAAMTTHGLIGP